jgi:hypothetical protein
MEITLTSRTRELSLREIVEKYPDIPRLIIIKTDVQRRGVYYTDRALDKVDETLHQTGGTHIFGTRDGRLTQRPESLLLRDSTSIITTPTPLDQNPYIVDFQDEQLVLLDEGKKIEEVEYWPKPFYYDKKTSSGVLMQHVVSSRPQRLYIMADRYCHFWKDDSACRFCDIVNNLKQQKTELGLPTKIRPADVTETIREALREPGRFSAVCLTSGSNPAGAEPFDVEVQYYVELLKAVGAAFATRKFPSQLISTAFTLKQLEKLYRETGLQSYTADIEILDENAFNWICPGKAKWVGYQEWKKRLIGAVGIFGRGLVNTCIVAGAELAKPYGFASEDDALRATLDEAESLAEYGVGTVFTVWIPRTGSFFAGQKNPSLEYFIRLAKGLYDQQKKYNVRLDFDDFRRCGNHPNSDLARIL